MLMNSYNTKNAMSKVTLVSRARVNNKYRHIYIPNGSLHFFVLTPVCSSWLSMDAYVQK